MICSFFFGINKNLTIIYMYGLNYHASSSGRMLPLEARCIGILQVQVDYGRGEWVTTSPINRTRTFFWPGSSLNAPANAASVLHSWAWLPNQVVLHAVPPALLALTNLNFEVIFLGVETPRSSLLFYMSVLPFLSAWQCESYFFVYLSCQCFKFYLE